MTFESDSEKVFQILHDKPGLSLYGIAIECGWTNGKRINVAKVHRLVVALATEGRVVSRSGDGNGVIWETVC